MLMGHRVRQGVDLELEADLDDIERGDAESELEIIVLALVICVNGKTWER